MIKKNICLLLPLIITSCKVQFMKDDETPTQTEDIIIKTPETVTDAINREVKVVKDNIKKVICIGAGALRLYSYVGNLDLLSGVEDIDRNVENANPFKDASRPYYDINVERFAELPSCGKGGPKNQAPDYEKIVNCKPDVIFSEYKDPDVVKEIEKKTGAKVVCLSYGNGSLFGEDIKKSLENISTLCGKEEDSAKNLITYINDCKKELEGIASKYTNQNKNKYYIGCLGNWGSQSFLSTSLNYPLFNVNGLSNSYAISSTTQLDNGKTDYESVIAANPNRIFLDAAGIPLLKKEYKENNSCKNALNQLDAVKHGEVYTQLPFNAYHTNLEIALINAYYISSVVYPSEYFDVYLKGKYDEITRTFLGIPWYIDIKSRPTSEYAFRQITDLNSFLNE